VKRSLVTILRVMLVYRPLAYFASSGAFFMLVGFAVGIRYLYFWVIGSGAGHVQSVIFSSLCLLLGALLVMMGVLADLVSVNRKLLERINLRVQRIELGLGQ
jgi:hypothetical protein